MTPDPTRILVSNHRTVWFELIQDAAKLTIIMALFAWGLS